MVKLNKHRILTVIIKLNNLGRLNVSVKVGFFFFLMRLKFKLVDCEQSELPSIMWVGLIQLTEDHKRILTSSKQEGILPADCFRTQTANLPWVSSLLAYSEILYLLSLHNYMKQFLKLNPSFLVLFLWITLNNRKDI